MDYQHQLFDSSNAFLPDEIKGESLYNWCVRFHRLGNNINPILTSKQLFNNPKAGFKHDFPTHLNSLAENTNYHFGTVEDLIQNKTIFPIFAPFLSSQAAAAIIQDMKNGNYARIKNQLGLRCSSISTIAPLKACRRCILEDTSSSGMAWWHIEHQLPTVRVCPIHNDYLQMATQEFHSHGPNDWYFPTDLPSTSWHDNPNLVESADTRLRSLCNWSLKLIKYFDKPFDHELLRLTYHLRAKSLGHATIDGTLKFNEVRLAFRDSYKCLENLPGFSFIRETIHDHGGFLGNILLKIGSHKQFLRHILMMEFLFNDPDIFFAEYERVLSDSFRLTDNNIWTELTDSRNPLKLLVTDGGYSVNVAARKLSIPLSQAISFLRKEGVEYKRRHRILDQQKEQALIRLLNDGEDCDEIFSKLEIRKSFIYDYLARHPDLRNCWREKAHNRLVENHRVIFIRYLADNPGLPIKHIRMDVSSSFQWLKLNDKNWLKQNLPGIWNG